MFKKYLYLVTLILTSAAIAFAQGTVKPRDADEAEAWQIYNQYKASLAAEAAANQAVNHARTDVNTTSLSSIGVFGSDPQDRADLVKARQQVAAERQRQTDLLKRWERFYWRYGDLAWAGGTERVKDAKTGRVMDRIEFAMTYIPFKYVPGKRVPANPKPTPTPVKPVLSTGGSTSLTLSVPGYWGTLSYTITGATLEPPTGSDRGNVGGRQYRGKITGRSLTVSGTAVSTNPSSGPGSMDYYELVVSVTAGKEHKEYGYIAPKGEKLSKTFSLTIPVTLGSSGGFSISLLEQNANYGPHGWVVTGSLPP